MWNPRALLVSAAAAVLSYQLLLPPVVALADNGDFPKIIGRFGLYPRVHRVYEFASTTYDFHPDRIWNSRFYSSEIPLARLAVFLNSFVSKDGSFDLRLIGIVHSTLFLAALWLFAPLLDRAGPLARFWVFAAVLFVFCDAMYASGLNSFYMDEPAYLFLLLSVVLYLRLLRRPSPLDAAALIACALLLAASKGQHAPLGFCIGALLLVNRRVLFPRRRAAFVSAAACIPLVSLFMLWKGAPSGYAANSVYDVVFSQLLPHSQNVPRTLAALRLDDSYLPLVGKNAYWADSRMDNPAFQREFRRRVSFATLAVFYATHPRDTWEALRDSLDQAGRESDFGNFDPAAGYPPRTESRAFRAWSRWKRRLFYHHGERLLAAFLACSALFALLLHVRRASLPAGAVSGGLTLIAMALLELAIASLGDAMDVARHHTIFFALFDILVLASLTLALVRPRNRTAAPDSPPGFACASPHPAPTMAAD